ncbi:hypothetical protein RIR_jg1521.t1 [Rhizophagus irregularis DAOM 181602=DAOM 197198]|nr:hypothetical protein RIR_jg1521.t1 [Rhizophagus irregularis DAOM 181602=DAOM 197198]
MRKKYKIGEISEVTALSSRHLPFNIHHEAKILQKICQASNLKNRPEGEFCTIGASRVYTVKNSSHKVY